MSRSVVVAALKVWLVVVHLSCALQSQSAKQQQIDKEVTGPKEESWRNLKHAFETDKAVKWQSCNSPRYDEYWDALPALDFEDLKIPPNSNILFYGHSMLHQVLDNIVIANKDKLIRDGPFGGFEGYNMHLKKYCEPDQDGSFVHYDGWITRWSFQTNSTILEIQNSGLLQSAENINHLKWWMDFHGPFDFVVYMNPHEKCFFAKIFDATDACLEGGLEQRDRDYHSARTDTNPLWNLLRNAVGANRIFEVEAWSAEKRQGFHADEAHVISATDILGGDACNQAENCNSSKVEGHQCQPGKLAKVAESIMQNMHAESTIP